MPKSKIEKIIKINKRKVGVSRKGNHLWFTFRGAVLSIYTLKWFEKFLWWLGYGNRIKVECRNKLFKNLTTPRV